MKTLNLKALSVASILALSIFAQGALASGIEQEEAQQDTQFIYTACRAMDGNGVYFDRVHAVGNVAANMAMSACRWTSPIPFTCHITGCGLL